MDEPVSLTVSEFVAIFNQVMDVAYRRLVITGELANFRISKNRWVYFDLKDDVSSVKFFGTVYQLPGPLEDGMLLKVQGQPRLHNLYGFSVNIINMQPAGEGSIRKAANLLQAKLAAEGLFDEARKRPLPYPPKRIGLITSAQSAAYADFIKILNARWSGLQIDLIDVQVQGEIAPSQIVNAIEQFNADANPPEVLVICRGGGSAEDLAAFSTETVTRAVAASRVPTLVAIGHEVDISLAELAADCRASTPSNAAELLVPDSKNVLSELKALSKQMTRLTELTLGDSRSSLVLRVGVLEKGIKTLLGQTSLRLKNQTQLIEAFNPSGILRRGYAIVRDSSGGVLRDAKKVKSGAIVDVNLSRGSFVATASKVKS